jgi:hypothetical protein
MRAPSRRPIPGFGHLLDLGLRFGWWIQQVRDHAVGVGVRVGVTVGGGQCDCQDFDLIHGAAPSKERAAGAALGLGDGALCERAVQVDHRLRRGEHRGADGLRNGSLILRSSPSACLATPVGLVTPAACQ